MSAPPPIRSSNASDLIGLARFLLIALIVAIAWETLSFLAGILAPILVALGIAYLLNPVLERLVRRGVNRSLGAAALLVLFVIVIVGVIVFLAPRIADQLAELVRSSGQLVTNFNAWLHSHFGFEMPAAWTKYLQSDEFRASLESVDGPLRDVATAAVGGAFHVLGVAAEFLLVPVFSFYFLTDWLNLLRRIDHMIPPRRRGEVREMMVEIDRVVAGWLRGQSISTSILMLLYATGFTLVGMPLSLPIGLVVGALTIIPFVGTFVGATIAVIVTLAGGGSNATLLGVGLVILCMHLLEAGVLTPKLVGHRVGLSESAALLAVVAGGKLLGFVGVVLAVPIAATCAVLLRYAVRYYQHTEFFGRETDADVVITPAMALIMPGVLPGAKVLAPTDPEPALDPELEDSDTGVTPDVDDWAITPELGAAGRPMIHEDEVVSLAQISAPASDTAGEEIAAAAHHPELSKESEKKQP